MTKTLYVTGKMYEANTVSITDAELVALVSAEQSDDDFWESLEELHDQLMGDSQVNGFRVTDGLPRFRASVDDEEIAFDDLDVDYSESKNTQGVAPKLGAHVLVFEKWSERGTLTCELKDGSDKEKLDLSSTAFTLPTGEVRYVVEPYYEDTHYLGRYVFTDSVSGESVEVKCPVIVDEVTWNSINLARKRKASRKDQQNATVKNFYLLRDFMVCGHCGRKMAGRIKPSKSEYMYYCPNKERVWAKDGESKTHYQRGTGCGFDRAMNIQITDKLVFDTVVQLHKDSSILKEEVRKRIFAEKGIKQISSEAEMKGYEKQHRVLQRELSNLQESIGHLEANRILKQMDDKAFKTAMERLNEQADRYKTDITNLRLKLRGEAEKKEWVDWIGMFGEEIKEKAKLTDEQRQLYLQGLIEKIECRFLPKTRDHELEIHFKHPIVGDKLKWNDPKVKAKGYKLLEGSKTTQIRVEKRDGRGK
jgi:hypothetical protein